LARKTMTREITTTLVKSAQIIMEDGEPKAISLPDESFVGNLSMEQAQRRINKMYENATVTEVQADTQTYEMPVRQFMEQATIKEVQ